MVRKYISNIKNKKIYILIISIIVVAAIFIFINNKNDGMENTNEVSIYYRTYTDENSWTSWSKNGLTSGDVNNSYPIKNIEFKIKTKKEGFLYYNFYSEKGWSKQLKKSKKSFNSIKGLKMMITDNIYDNYDICYRTYNNKNKWLEWSCNQEINGNKNENILAIQIKVIPKSIKKNEWLKDYNKNVDVKKNIGF